MDREKEDNYTWVVNRLRTILDKCMHPRVIITDRELALVNACATVFPDAARLLCRWHIEQNILGRANKSITSKDDRDSFLYSWKLLVESPTWEAYTRNYTRLQSKLMKYPGVLTYIEENWLNNYREMFVSVWVDQHLKFGNRTTNRVESQHAKLKKYLLSANKSLDKFVQKINEIVQSQLTSIYESFENSISFRFNQHDFKCFGLLRGFVSNEALDIMLGELQRSNDLNFDPTNCGCKLRSSCGLPCACMLMVYSSSGESIPLDSIDIFWRKLKISDTMPLEDDDVFLDAAFVKFKESYKKQSNAGKKMYMKRIEEIYDPHTTKVGEPTVQKNTRGRPSVKKQQKKHANPPKQAPRRCSFSNTSDFFGFDLNKQPERHSFSYGVDLDDVPQRPDPFLMASIPEIFHDFIDDIHDVEGDGNCGFRAVAVCLGLNEDRWLDIRMQLIEELHSHSYAYRHAFTAGFDEIYDSLCWFDTDAPMQHWMTIPLTGYLIANKFGVIFHCYSYQNSMTCFPLWRGPEECQPHRIVALAHTNGNHYMSLSLKRDYPMPPTTIYWNTHRSQIAYPWLTLYWSRFELFNQLRPRSYVPPSMHIIDD